MAIRAAKKTNNTPEADKNKAQLELVVKSPEDKRQELANLIAQIKLKKIERKRILGEAKVVLNEIKELVEKSEDLAAECASGQLLIELKTALADDAEEADLEGRVMDVSNIKTPEEMREKSEFLKGIEDSLEEYANRPEDKDENE